MNKTMKQASGKFQSVVIGMAFGLAIGVAAMDLAFPSGTVWGLLYVCLVMLSLASDRRMLTFLAATAFTLMVAYDHFSAFTDLRAVPFPLLARVSFLLVAIWVPVCAAFATKRVEEHQKHMDTPLHLCPSCKKVRDAQGVWSKLEDFLNKEVGREMATGFCPGCRNKWTAGQAYQNS